MQQSFFQTCRVEVSGAVFPAKNLQMSLPVSGLGFRDPLGLVQKSVYRALAPDEVRDNESKGEDGNIWIRPSVT